MVGVGDTAEVDDGGMDGTAVAGAGSAGVAGDRGGVDGDVWTAHVAAARTAPVSRPSRTPAQERSTHPECLRPDRGPPRKPKLDTLASLAVLAEAGFNTEEREEARQAEESLKRRIRDKDLRDRRTRITL